jgi:hypothetical protein
MIAEGHYSRALVSGVWGHTHGVPTQCGKPIRGQPGKTCTCIPTWLQQGQWVCGRHRENKLEVRTIAPPTRFTPFECSICLCDCKRLDTYTTKCKHRFHSKCMHEWSKRSDAVLTCPLCRTKLEEPSMIPQHNLGEDPISTFAMWLEGSD